MSIEINPELTPDKDDIFPDHVPIVPLDIAREKEKEEI